MKRPWLKDCCDVTRTDLRPLAGFVSVESTPMMIDPVKVEVRLRELAVLASTYSTNPWVGSWSVKKSKLEKKLLASKLALKLY